MSGGQGLPGQIGAESITRPIARLAELLRQGRGRWLVHAFKTLNPVLRGWMNYFQFDQTRTRIVELDVLVRQRLPVIICRP